MNQPDHVSKKIQTLLRPRLRFLAKGAPIPAGENLGKLGLDSMGAIDLLFELEQAFDVKIPDSLLTTETFETAAALEAAVRAVVEKKSPA